MTLLLSVLEVATLDCTAVIQASLAVMLASYFQLAQLGS